ncbi:uncharacterized protein TRAVEDRAFT_131048 [Trametes versicolor FP-101664 SS1]|uniref:uncharacterized protein n=1 Tax=Trametes versicolor (strain FP-101664) TaxID=717944 RepID=UPI0004623A6C|nr:uncharacterized protein TRAVEDRAFT_131048 [Trametes versicolor FP-101664 SS1]EIW54985.1 hypothetical protein TRAVEDRAFT_131048 [Trametes versicolor FP-101664 SS1]
MRFTTLVPLFLAVPATVFACEGDCIVAITNAFLGNYSRPMQSVMGSMAAQISNIIPSHPDEQTAMTYLQPIISAYQKEAYQGMETAIFPNFFHGKCLNDQGIEPDGCPNPDCSIVCGTPGSMVHYYSKLRFIAFNETYHHLQRLCTPGTDAYKRAEQAVVAAAGHDERRRSSSRIYSRALSNAVLVPVFLKRADDVKSEFKSIMQQAHGLLSAACGGDGVQETNGLPECSWEEAMKEYILSFP